MFFNSMKYLIFLPIVFIVYYLLPQKIRYIWLLIVSYYFYMCWNAKYALLMLTITAITYFSSLLIEKFRSENKTKASKALLIITIVLNFAFLFYFKYFNFAIENINRLLQFTQWNTFSFLEIILPVGISFFIFQAVGYTIDVYRGETRAERNPLKYALFISFFPQLVAGPIERSKNLLKQLAKRFYLMQTICEQAWFTY